MVLSRAFLLGDETGEAASCHDGYRPGGPERASLVLIKRATSASYKPTP